MDSQCVGPTSGRGEHTLAATRVLALAEKHDLCFLNTFFDCGPTYYSNSGEASRIDFLLLPRGFRAEVDSCAIPWKAARALQLISSPAPRDHVPVEARLRYVLRPGRPRLPGPRWNRDRIAEALQVGSVHRANFLTEVAGAFEKVDWSQLENRKTPDAHWERIITTIRETGSRYFATQDEDEHQRALQDLRQARGRLLGERGRLRHQCVEQGADLERLQGQLKEVGTQIRRLERRFWRQRVRTLEHDLEMAWRQRRLAVCQRLCYQLSGRRRGPKKRVLGAAPDFAPEAKEVSDYFGKPGAEGGLSATEVDFQDETERWEQEHRELAPLTADHCREGQQDFYNCLATLKKAIKRKAAPAWSAPSELILMCMSPYYYSKRKGGRGLGHDDPTDWHQTARRLRRLCVHTRRAGVAPTTAHRSQSVPLPKRNGKKQMAALRWIHIFCPFWRAWFKQLLDTGVASLLPFWPSYVTGFLPRRRRENCMAALRVVSWRLNMLKLPFADIFYDLSNAFGSTTHEHLLLTLPTVTRLTDKDFFEQRIRNSAFSIVALDREITMIVGEGTLMGSSEGPLLFARAFTEELKQWVTNFSSVLPESSRGLRLRCTFFRTLHDGGLFNFADDVARKVLLPPSKVMDLRTVTETVALTTSLLQEALAPGGHRLNQDKTEVVPTLRSPNLQKLYQKSEPRARRSVRHLGGRYSASGSTTEERSKRILSLKVAWVSMGQFWFRKASWRLKKLCVQSYLQSVLLTGLESYWWSQADCRFLDGHLVRLLRAMMRGTACRFLEGQHPTALSTEAVLRYWEIMPSAVELACRRVGWLKAMVAFPGDFGQLIAAVWGDLYHLPNAQRQLDEADRPYEHSNPLLRQFEQDLQAFAHLESARSFFACWRDEAFSWRAFFCAPAVAAAFAQLDPHELRAAWLKGTPLTRQAAGPVAGGGRDGGGDEEDEAGLAGEEARRWICRLQDDEGRECGVSFGSLRALAAHQTFRQGGTHGLTSLVALACVSNQCIWCGAIFSVLRTAYRHMLASCRRGRCTGDRSQWLWRLEPPPSLVCPFEGCGFTAPHLATLYQHLAEVHLPPVEVLLEGHAEAPPLGGAAGSRTELTERLLARWRSRRSAQAGTIEAGRSSGVGLGGRRPPAQQEGEPPQREDRRYPADHREGHPQEHAGHAGHPELRRRCAARAKRGPPLRENEGADGGLRAAAPEGSGRPAAPGRLRRPRQLAGAEGSIHRGDELAGPRHILQGGGDHGDRPVGRAGEDVPTDQVLPGEPDAAGPRGGSLAGSSGAPRLAETDWLSTVCRQSASRPPREGVAELARRPVSRLPSSSSSDSGGGDLPPVRQSYHRVPPPPGL